MTSFTRSAGLRRGFLGALAVLAGAGLLGPSQTMHAATPAPAAAYLATFPAFAPNLTPQMPGDVDPALKSKLEKAKMFARVQREFDLYSWQMFLALNWPTNAQGQPAPSIANSGFGAPHWTLWHNSSDIFQTKGDRPATCATPGGAKMLTAVRELAHPVSRGLKAFSTTATANADPRATRFLGVISAVGELNAGNIGGDIQQAFTGPLIDQNGEFVFYEIMIDPNETAYLCANSLYNINGQVAFAQNPKNMPVVMPSGVPAVDWSGSFELKFAWRILKPGKDDFGRFYTSAAVVMDQGKDGKPVERSVTVGLVGMHIGHKTKSSPQWIWSTFEQIDNLDVDPVAHPNLKPSFSDPNCPICAVNQQPTADASGVYPRTPVQAWRAIPVPGDKQALNAQAAAVLRRLGSVWQYYQLIDTQWPTDPSAKPAPWNGPLPAAVTNKPGGNPTPVMLTNITMETYFQHGNQPACKMEELPPGVACPTPAQAWNTLFNAAPKPPVPIGNTTAFITESCTGCHSSAGIYTSYDPARQTGTTSGQLSADFSWLMSQKAAWHYGSGGAGGGSK